MELLYLAKTVHHLISSDSFIFAVGSLFISLPYRLFHSFILIVEQNGNLNAVFPLKVQSFLYEAH